jgi:hypothetical protein
MRLFFTLLFFLLGLNSFSYCQSYCSDFIGNCDKAVLFYQENKTALSKIASKYGYDSKFIYSLVAPEVANFSDFEDAWQMTALEILYIDYGVSYANFSVGRFQLKPSFLESIEQEVRINDKLSYFNDLIYYKSSDEKEIRTERLKRMRYIEWQFKYLCLFYAIMELKYNDLKFSSTQDKLRFYSTALNHSYKACKEETLKWQKVAYFPKGFFNSKYIFCEVCVELFNRI